jgi:hypothetical protein
MSKENLPTKSVLESVEEQKTSSEPEIPKLD